MHTRQRTQLGERLGELRGAKGHLFAHLNGRGSMVDAKGKQGHAFDVFIR